MVENLQKGSFHGTYYDISVTGLPDASEVTTERVKNQHTATNVYFPYLLLRLLARAL